MERVNLYLTLDNEIINRYKEHLDMVGYDKNKLFEKIIIDFLKKNDIES
jgi:hypothetical protein